MSRQTYSVGLCTMYHFERSQTMWCESNSERTYLTPLFCRELCYYLIRKLCYRSNAAVNFNTYRNLYIVASHGPPSYSIAFLSTSVSVVSVLALSQFLYLWLLFCLPVPYLLHWPNGLGIYSEPVPPWAEMPGWLDRQDWKFFNLNYLSPQFACKWRSNILKHIQC